MAKCILSDAELGANRKRATAWRLANIDRARAYDRERAAAARAIDPEGVNARIAAWVKKNPDRVKLYRAKHRAKLRKDPKPPRTAAELLEVKRACSKAWRLRNIDKRKAARRAWYEANKDHVRLYNTTKRQSDPDKSRERQRAWYKANPDASRTHAATRRARKMSVSGAYTAADLAVLLLRQKGRCAMCGIKLKPNMRHADHIMPFARGGDNTLRNIQWLCRPCNLSKHARHPIEFAQSRGLLL